MLTTISDPAPHHGGARVRACVAPQDWQPIPRRARVASPWRSPTFYLAIPLTALLFAAIWVIRTVSRLRPVGRTHAAAVEPRRSGGWSTDRST